MYLKVSCWCNVNTWVGICSFSNRGKLQVDKILSKLPMRCENSVEHIYAKIVF